MNKALSWLCKIFLAPIIKIIFIKKINGEENVPSGNFILVANHQSHLDEIATALVCLPRKFRFIGRVDEIDGVAKIFLDLFYSLFGVIPLDRKSKESKKKVIKEAIGSLKKNNILILYPEGTRTRTGKMGEGKVGTAKFLLATGTPILPIWIKGTAELLPPGGKLKIKKTISINIGKPIFFKQEFNKAKTLDSNSEEYKKLLEEMTKKIMNEIFHLRQEA